MAKTTRKQIAPLEVTSFVKGLVTDANPLSFPENASLDGDNMVLERNGLNRRRFGMDYEADHTVLHTNITATTAFDNSFSLFKWDNAGGDSEKSIAVVQISNRLDFFDLGETAVTKTHLHSRTFSGVSPDAKFSFSVVDGVLIAVNGDQTIYKFEYDSSSDSISRTMSRILVRDLWGVQDVTGGVDLRESNNISTRPSTLTNAHLYNLRNQSFGTPRAKRTSRNREDPLDTFYNGDLAGQTAPSVYPSNSDSVNYALYPNSADIDGDGDPFSKRFYAYDLFRNPIGTSEAAKGYYIIDLLNRGGSRLTENSANDSRYPDLNSTSHTVSSLPGDNSVNGATLTTAFAGRAFFAGFSGNVQNPDDKSPRLSSYVMFSRLVKDVSDINLCYQRADPTSDTDSVLVATDGGFVRIDEAYGINAIKVIANSLVILASNGVWRLRGGNSFGFSAENFLVDRVGENGCIAPNSVVEVDGRIMYWGADGIYAVGGDALGDWKAVNITQDVVQNLYDDIDFDAKELCSGVFDKFDRKIRWVYNTRLNSTDPTKELIFDVDLKSFYTSTVEPTATSFPKVVAVGESNPYTITKNQETVVVGGDVVQVGGVDVVVSVDSKVSGTRELVYLAVTSTTPTIKYTISKYRDLDFVDWSTYDSVGVDSPAYILTGLFKTGDNQHRKNVSSLVVHLLRTEDGFTLNGSGDIVPVNESSCIVQAQWGWTNSVNSGRWSVPRQYYRYPRMYMPANVDDPYDTGYSTIVTKDIIRGNGKALSLKFSTEPGKDMQIYGWSMVWGIGSSHGQ